MSKVAVVYWSGTGNTEAMAYKIVEGAKEEGAQVSIFTPETFAPADMDLYDAIAFGCPAMGAEVLEEEEFEPMFQQCEPKLNGKKIILFGSYGWGDGEWMRNWESDCGDKGAILISESVICCEAPEGDLEEMCISAGKLLAQTSSLPN